MGSSSWIPESGKQSRSNEWLSYLYGYGRKEPNTRERFVTVSKTNLAIARELLDNAKRLSKARRYSDAEKLTDLAKELLDNNANLLTVVGDVLDKK
jgi:hypothetical protein